MKKKRILETAAAAGCMIVVAAVFFFLRSKTGEVVLINAAQESVIHATVQINGAKFNFDDIPPDAIRRLKYKTQADNQYTISVEFRYERKLGPQTGYFTDRVKTDHQLLIKRNEIVLESGKN